MGAAMIRRFNRTLLLACTPFAGMLLWLVYAQVNVPLSDAAFPPHVIQPLDPGAAAADIMAGLEQAHSTAQHTGESIQKQLTLYNQTTADMKMISSLASGQAARPYQIYDRRITSKLGKPAATIQSEKLNAQLFYLDTQTFRGYALKIKLKQKDAMKLVLGGDEPGDSETTLEAVKRHKAAVGVNAGGFADGEGKRYPLGTTIVDGEYVNGFHASVKDLFFVGLNEDGKLIGGNFTSKDKLDKLNPEFGATFVPVLLKNGRRTEIPAKWQTSPKRAPRTVIANYKDNQLLFLIADGYDEKGSSGATLIEMQILLQRYGAIDGYNLDGGGSTSLVFNGRIINNPSDSKLRKLPTHFLFFK